MMESGALPNTGHAGKPGPFGLPLVIKFAQYEDMISASPRSASVHGQG